MEEKLGAGGFSKTSALAEFVTARRRSERESMGRQSISSEFSM